MRTSWENVLTKVMTTGQDELPTLFRLLLTEDERNAIAGRLKVFQLLLNGEMSQRKIAADFNVSIATITRCSNYLKHMSTPQREQIKLMLLSPPDTEHEIEKVS